MDYKNLLPTSSLWFCLSFHHYTPHPKSTPPTPYPTDPDNHTSIITLPFASPIHIQYYCSIICIPTGCFLIIPLHIETIKLCLWSLICGMQDLTEALLLIWAWYLLIFTSDLAYLLAFIFNCLCICSHALVLHWTNLGPSALGHGAPLSLNWILNYSMSPLLC